MREDVEFAAHAGTILRGWFYPGAGDAPGPALVMSHGFSATRAMALDDYAALFAAAGIGALVYDHRGLGASDGTPRQYIDPFVQTRDMLSAIDWLAACPQVDPDRIGLWGSSYSGGEVLVAGAMDARVRAVIANVPFVGEPGKTGGSFEALARAVRLAAFDLDAMVGPVPVVIEPGDERRALMPIPEATEWFLGIGRKPGTRWVNEVWRPTTDRAAAFDPALAVPHLHGPALFIAAKEDRLAPAAAARAAYALAGPGSDYVEVDGHHFTPYAGAALGEVAAITIDFLRRTL